MYDESVRKVESITLYMVSYREILFDLISVIWDIFSFKKLNWFLCNYKIVGTSKVIVTMISDSETDTLLNTSISKIATGV